MMEAEHLTNDDVAVLRAVSINAALPNAEDPAVAEALAARGFIRRDDAEWVLTIDGHLAFVRALRDRL